MIMMYQTLTEVWLHVLDFIQENQQDFGDPMIRVYSDEVELRYRTINTIKSLPQGCENWRMYADEGHLVFVGTWEYNSDSNHLDKEHV